MKGINPDTGKTTSRYDFCDSRRHRKLQDAADRLLAKSGYFARDNEQSISDTVEADAISNGSRLRPTWVGRA